MYGQKSNSSAPPGCPIDAPKAAFLDEVKSRLEGLIDGFYTIERRMAALRERAFGPSPKDEAGEPSVVPNGHIANLSEKFEILERIHSNIVNEMMALERIG